MDSYSHRMAVFFNANLSGFGGDPCHRKVEVGKYKYFWMTT